MFKNKYVVIGASVTIALAILGFGGWFWYSKSQSRTFSSDYDGDANISDMTLSPSANDGSIPLNGQQESSDSGGLRVSSGASGGGLGQLNPGQEQGNPMTGNSGNGGSSSGSPFDPAGFAQYEKYKNENSALFADVQKGTGEELTPNKKAAVYYRGWLTNGQLFDQSRQDEKGQLQPFIFTLGGNQVIRGWEEGMAGMKVGGSRMLIVPPAAGYGPEGQGSIPGDSVLIFEVHLLDVE